eukprot:TRINITY_DN8349_c0_g1_i1.p9 TRINITY_DN8349_c0_g1~~TRINITY_DN8349_c0_g1_i1.p9  ORF type:complete len:106 (-),score=1.20 TRINITY_DN8349_c0_g1_i1:23-340(-)
MPIPLHCRYDVSVQRLRYIRYFGMQVAQGGGAEMRYLDYYIYLCYVVAYTNKDNKQLVQFQLCMPLIYVKVFLVGMKYELNVCVGLKNKREIQYDVVTIVIILAV